MKIVVKYISHFWYVAINWNIWMAFFMLYDNIRGSIKYGSNTFAPIELKNLTIVHGDIKNASRYEAVSFYMLEHLFRAFRKISDKSSIIDLGCGKGRMMMVAAHFGFKRITGIDFAKEVCEQAKLNMRKKENQFPGIIWNVINQNVDNYEIEPNDCVFFMFNPFSYSVLKNFLRKLDVSCDEFPRTIYVLYASPQYEKLLLDRGYAIIYQKKKMYLKSIIAVRD
ncbi:MAG TPA: class I SAM-dependent methyltransferase [Chitinophagaceae bacterium]|nr:class I SAM-dependent methyltransferase [Chitinophagaceae bacterium]